jgi:hypothetical protein
MENKTKGTKGRGRAQPAQPHQQPAESAAKQDAHEERGQAAVPAIPDAYGVPGVKDRPGGIVLPGDLSKEDWLRVGTVLVKRTTRVQWDIGTWLNFGRAKRYISREHYDNAIGLLTTDYSRQTLRDLAWVAGKFQSSRRRDDLSWSHHREVVSLPEADQDRLLAQAASEGWSRTQLRVEVQRLREPPADEDLEELADAPDDAHAGTPPPLALEPGVGAGEPIPDDPHPENRDPPDLNSGSDEPVLSQAQASSDAEERDGDFDPRVAAQLADALRMMLDDLGFELPLHFAAIASNGAVMAGTYRLDEAGGELACRVTVEPTDMVTTPVNIMYVDARGEAARVVIGPSGTPRVYH